MKKFLFALIFFIAYQSINGQVSSVYTISFKNAVHHEANVHATFKDLKNDEVEFRMSRSSPGRYALHEFAKNVRRHRHETVSVGVLVPDARLPEVKNEAAVNTLVAEGGTRTGLYTAGRLHRQHVYRDELCIGVSRE